MMKPVLVTKMMMIVSKPDEDSLDDSDSSLSPYNFILDHEFCFAHTLQLVVKDGLKEIGSLKRVLERGAKIVGYVHKSQKATEIPKVERRLQPKNDTRWNSQLISINLILNRPEDKLNLLETAHFTTYERKMLQDLVNILMPFQEATRAKCDYQ